MPLAEMNGTLSSELHRELHPWGSDALTTSSETSLEPSQARSDHTWMGQRVFYKLTVTFSRSKEVSVARIVTTSHREQPPRHLGHCFDTAQQGNRWAQAGRIKFATPRQGCRSALEKQRVNELLADLAPSPPLANGTQRRLTHCTERFWDGGRVRERWCAVSPTSQASDAR